MKVIHIVNLPWFSGVTAYALDLARCMRDAGMDITFAVVGFSAAYEKISSEFETIGLSGRNLTGTLRGAGLIKKRGERYDAAFAHTGSSLSIAFSLKKAGLAGKIVRVRAERMPIKRNIPNRIIHRQVDLCIAPTEKIKRDFTGFGIDEDRILLINPVVDIDMFGFSPIPHNNTVGIVGRLSRVKGYFWALEAFAALLREVPDADMFIAGKEDQVTFEKLNGYAETLGIADRISYKGRLRYEDVPALMRTARAGFISSLGSEAVSRAALEWFSCGRPVVASGVGCLDEFITGGNTGFITGTGDPGGAAQYLARILKDRPLNEKMGFSARKTAEEKFSPAACREYFRGGDIIKLSGGR